MKCVHLDIKFNPSKTICCTTRFISEKRSFGQTKYLHKICSCKTSSAFIKWIVRVFSKMNSHTSYWTYFCMLNKLCNWCKFDKAQKDRWQEVQPRMLDQIDKKFIGICNFSVFVLFFPTKLHFKKAHSWIRTNILLRKLYLCLSAKFDVSI